MKTTRILTILVFALMLSAFVHAQKSDSKQEKKGGVVFKIPKDVFPQDWNKQNFRGILMLKKDSPAGVFVTYPNDNESIEELKMRAAKFIAPMFIHDKEEERKIGFEKASIPNHDGDFGNSGEYYSFRLLTKEFFEKQNHKV